MEKQILITGGAGYIGSHLAKNLLREGYEVVIFDNLSSGYIEPIKILQKKFPNLEFIKGDLSNKEQLRELFGKNSFETVMHLAAKIDARESIEKKDLYAQENYHNGINLVETMTRAGVKKLIFSSTCAVYGEPKYFPIDEKHPTRPGNPYGQSKLDFEKYLGKVKNLGFIILRYFNVGGADPEGQIGKSHFQYEELLENIMKVALGERNRLEIFGSDFDTKDGTPIRDFVHVEDVNSAHISAMRNIEKLSGEIFNLGSEKGNSIKEVLITAENVIGKTIPVKFVGSKPGDIVRSVASSKKAKEVLGWSPKYSKLETIILTDWNWRKKHPRGYEDK